MVGREFAALAHHRRRVAHAACTDPLLARGDRLPFLELLAQLGDRGRCQAGAPRDLEVANKGIGHHDALGFRTPVSQAEGPAMAHVELEGKTAEIAVHGHLVEPHADGLQREIQRSRGAVEAVDTDELPADLHGLEGRPCIGVLHEDGNVLAVEAVHARLELGIEVKVVERYLEGLADAGTLDMKTASRNAGPTTCALPGRRFLT